MYWRQASVSLRAASTGAKCKGATKGHKGATKGRFTTHALEHVEALLGSGGGDGDVLHALVQLFQPVLQPAEMEMESEPRAAIRTYH